MLISVIETPLDFERTLDTPVYRVNQWTLPGPQERAREIDSAVSDVFGAREAADLDSIAGPLEHLHALGLQVVAVVTRGRYVIAADNEEPGRPGPPVEVADYLVAPDPCYFRSHDADFSAPVHKLGAACPEGHAAIVETPPGLEEKDFSIWVSRRYLERDFEFSVPWCAACEQADDGDGPRG